MLDKQPAHNLNTLGQAEGTFPEPSSESILQTMSLRIRNLLPASGIAPQGRSLRTGS